MGGFGSPIHWLVIGVVALLLFGKRLPEVARSMGKAIKEFKKGLSDVTDEFNRAGTEDEEPKKKLDAPEGQRAERRLDDQSGQTAKDFAAGDDSAGEPVEQRNARTQE